MSNNITGKVTMGTGAGSGLGEVTTNNKSLTTHSQLRCPKSQNIPSPTGVTQKS
jgi:hypothetical protein